MKTWYLLLLILAIECTNSYNGKTISAYLPYSQQKIAEITRRSNGNIKVDNRNTQHSLKIVKDVVKLDFLSHRQSYDGSFPSAIK